MNRLILSTVVLTVLSGVGFCMKWIQIGSDRIDRKELVAEFASEMEKRLAQAPLSLVEQERLDQLSQKYPQAMNAFHKLYALSRMEMDFPIEAYSAISKKYVMQLSENQKQSQELLRAIVEFPETDAEANRMRNLARDTFARLASKSLQ
jgi:hypothetical protein